MTSSPNSKTLKVLRQDDNESRGIASSALKLAVIPLRPLRPLLPHLLPVVVCLLCIPVLMFLSAAAGLAVWNSVPVGWKVETYLQYGDAANPSAITQLPPIFENQPYDISLHLVLPATEANYGLGNFMTTLRLSTTYNESLITVRRATALVPPRTSVMKEFVMGSHSIINLDIPLLSQFVVGDANVIAYLELGRPDAWRNLGNGQQRELSVAEATLKGTVRPTGIRAIRARYPRLTTFLSMFIFFFVSIMVVAGFIFSAIGGKSSTHPPPTDEDEGSESDRVNDTYDDPYFKPRLATRSGYKDRESESDSPTNEDPKSNVKSEENLPLSGLRQRRSMGNTDTHKRPSQIKIEADDAGQRHNANLSIYPKSPFPYIPSAMDTDLEVVSPQQPEIELNPSS